MAVGALRAPAWWDQDGLLELVETLLRDGLLDAFNGYHMGTTAENVAQAWQLMREEQERFGPHEQRKAAEAQEAGRFREEIVPVTVPARAARCWSIRTSTRDLVRRSRPS